MLGMAARDYGLTWNECSHELAWNSRMQPWACLAMAAHSHWFCLAWPRVAMGLVGMAARGHGFAWHGHGLAWNGHTWPWILLDIAAWVHGFCWANFDLKVIVELLNVIKMKEKKMTKKKMDSEWNEEDKERIRDREKKIFIFL